MFPLCFIHVANLMFRPSARSTFFFLHTAATLYLSFEGDDNGQRIPILFYCGYRLNISIDDDQALSGL